ncbi:MAG TPA: DUF3501 family protein [Polyangiaceae bacterium]|jgi:hypothetical protein|nr:DUF3501 family protein [Polyangiaceae bacterium]
MTTVSRGELLGLAEYEQIREPFRRRIMALKQARRVALGPNMTVLFENHDTALYQIQEMLRTERITAEKAILHELETYNELVPGARELSATVFLEFPERALRERMLVALAGVETAFYLRVAGERLAVVGDTRGTDPSQTMAVQYVKFPLSESAERALRADEMCELSLGVEHAAYRAEVVLSAETAQSLRDDLP